MYNFIKHIHFIISPFKIQLFFDDKSQKHQIQSFVPRKLNIEKEKEIKYSVKLKVLVLSRKSLCLIIVAILCFVGVILHFSLSKEVFQPSLAKTVVIDAGHGGIDGGCIGINGTIESELNLKYSYCLKKQCEDMGLRVVLTRKDENGLYSPLAENKKKSEMKKREEIIKNSNCDLVISVHMNSLNQKSVKGSQCFFKEGCEQGKVLAEEITGSLKEDKFNVRAGAKEGDFYVLNCTDKPAVLIECGFLSNHEEERLLNKDKYCQDFCGAVLEGILQFLKM